MDQSQKDREHTEGYETPHPPTPEFAKPLSNPHQSNINGIGVDNFEDLNVLSEKKSGFHEFMGIGPLRRPIWGTL